MRCCDCEFHQSGYMWNRCALTDSECYREPELCDLIDDNYIVLQDCEPLGLVKGESVLKYIEGDNDD